MSKRKSTNPITGYFAKKSRIGKLNIKIDIGINLAIKNNLGGNENSQTTVSPSASDTTCDPISNVEDDSREHSEHGQIDSK